MHLGAAGLPRQVHQLQEEWHTFYERSKLIASKALEPPLLLLTPRCLRCISLLAAHYASNQ